MQKRCIFCQKVSYVDESETDCPQCGNTNKLTPFVHVAQGFVRGKFEPFKSTVDGTIIDSHAKMQEHNKRNDVICVADGYSNEAVLSGNFTKPKEEKLCARDLANDIGESIMKLNNGYRPEVQYED